MNNENSIVTLIPPDMPICTIDRFKTELGAQKRLVGLDVGKKSIGIATCDPDWRLATPLLILWRQKFTDDMGRLFAILDEQGEIGGMVIGWPLNMDGTAGRRCDSVRDFTHALLRLRDMPVLLQDERLSTQAVERSMLAADLSRAKRQTRRDALAASWILQSTLDQLNG